MTQAIRQVTDLWSPVAVDRSGDLFTRRDHLITIAAVRIGDPGFWIDSLGGSEPSRPPLPGARDCDVAIVGGGFTGLWTAYYLKRADKSLRITVLEADRVGHGASGRNGGWVAGFCSGARRVYARSAGREAVVVMQRAMFATVKEIEGVLLGEGIDADFVQGGYLLVALNQAQQRRLHNRIAEERAWGLGEADIRLLSAEELAARVRLTGGRAAIFSPHVARVHPAKLVRGLAMAVERLGVTIHEHTPVLAIEPRRAITAHGDVRADWVVRATEGYTARLRGVKRELIPMNSSMIMTAPLAPAARNAVGWMGHEVISDAANVYVYMQCTADGRVTIGGRGHPYRFGSATGRVGDIPRSTIDSLYQMLCRMMPSLSQTEVTHAWSGVLGVSRDWCVSATADPAAGVAWAGGYVGEGVAASNLAGRTLSDLLRGERSELTALPWVDRRPRRWEPEPLRWPMVHAVYSLYRIADRIEAQTGRPARLATLVDGLSGRR